MSSALLGILLPAGLCIAIAVQQRLLVVHRAPACPLIPPPLILRPACLLVGLLYVRHAGPAALATWILFSR